MAITNLEDWRTRVSAPFQRVHDTKNSLAATNGRLSSQWANAPDAGVAPTTAAVPTRATAGAMGQLNAATSVLRIAQAVVSCAVPTTFILADRLSHQGGLSAIVTTAQTTNLPTAALTRYTGGDGVQIGLEIYTVIGTTGTTVTASYTNQAGTTGRTTEAVVFGGTGFREVGRLILLPLQQGDTGVRSVENVDLLATTATAGNFGVTLIKPLYSYPVYTPSDPALIDSMFSLCGSAPEVVDDAALQWLAVPSTGVTGVSVSHIRFIED